MKRSPCGLHVDFVHRNGDYMVLFDEEGLSHDRLSHLQVNMLRANNVPRLLPMSVEETDGVVQFVYDITGTKMVSQRLRHGAAGLADQLRLLLSVADAVSDSGTYMLLGHQFELDADFMFCGDDLADVRLTYVPLAAESPGRNVNEKLRLFAAECLQNLNSAQREKAHRVTAYLLDGQFHVRGFKQLLLRELGGMSGIGDGGNVSGQVYGDAQAGAANPLYGRLLNRAPQFAYGGEQAGAVPRDYESVYNGSPPTQNSVRHVDGQKDGGTDTENANVSAGSLAYGQLFTLKDSGQAYGDSGGAAMAGAGPAWDDSASNKEPLKLPIPVTVITLLGVALIWKWYLEHAGEPALYIAVGGTLLLADCAYYLLAVRRPVVMRPAFRLGGGKDDFGAARGSSQTHSEADDASARSGPDAGGGPNPLYNGDGKGPDGFHPAADRSHVNQFAATGSGERASQTPVAYTWSMGSEVANEHAAPGLTSSGRVTGLGGYPDKQAESMPGSSSGAAGDSRIVQSRQLGTNTARERSENRPPFQPLDGIRAESGMTYHPFEAGDSPLHRSGHDSIPGTTLLSPSEATILLTPSLSPHSSAMLERSDGGGGVTERFALIGASFVIGRGETGVHYALDKLGVSRTHAEWMQAEGHYMVKDLGSRNGTLLNGEPMVPYKVYNLREGDIVTIVSVDFTFKMGS